MLGVKIRTKSPSKKARVPESSINLDQQDVIQDAKPLQMIVPFDVSTNPQSKKTTKKVRTSNKNSSAVAKSTDSRDKGRSTETIITPNKDVDITTETNTESPSKPMDTHEVPSNVEPHGEPANTDVEPNVEPSGTHVDPTTEPTTETSTETPVHENLEDLSKKGTQNIEPDVQGHEEADQDDEDNIPIAKIMKKIRVGATIPQDIINVDEETETDEEVTVRVQSVADRVKRKKSQKVEIPKASMKNTAAVQKQKEKSVKKKRKVENQATEERSLKRKLILPSESETDGEEDVQDIVPSGKRKIGGKRVPENVPPAPMDNVSFHSESNVQKWKYVYQRRIARERELSQEALDCKEVMELLEVAGLMKTVTNLGRCYEKLVKEFIVNITDECSEGSEEYRKVYVRGKCVKFSPTTINEYLGRSKTAETEEVDLIRKVTEEITGGQVKQWPKKGLLSTGSLSVKYAILNRIGAANWAPTNHSSGITPMLAKIIFLIGTKANINFGEYVFNQTMKHAESFAVKLPIAFPCLITEIILSQHPEILQPEEVQTKKPAPLTFDYRLFVGTHVPDIVVTKPQDQSAAGTSTPLSNSTSKEILLELMEVSKALGETIRTSTIRKKNVDNLIKMMTKEQEAEEEEEVGNEEAETSSAN